MKVLISGAGIAGPCLAYWLARTRQTIQVTIVERSPQPRVTGQSIDIRGPAIEVMKRMNLEEAVRALHTSETGTSFINSSGKSVAQFNRGNVFTAEYEILRADLSGLLLDATQGMSNVKYVYGDSVTSLEQNGKEVNVTFKGGSMESYDVVVAADGAASKTRSMILGEDITKNCYDFLGWYIAFFSIPSQAGDEKLWKWYNAPKGLSIMTRPHRTGSTMGAYLGIVTPKHGQPDAKVEKALETGVEAQKSVLHEHFSKAGWEAERVLEGMDQADDFYMSRAAHVKLSKWTNGRGVVIGDSAFATFGVGTSLAIISAYVLAGELSKVGGDVDIPQALENYEAAFRSLYKEMGGGAGGFAQIAFPQTTWAISVGHSLLWMLAKSRIYKLMPAEESVKWKLPDYDWRELTS